MPAPISIIIPTLNNIDYLKICLESLKKNSKYEHEIIPHVNIGNDGIAIIASIKNINNLSTGPPIKPDIEPIITPSRVENMATDIPIISE